MLTNGALSIFFVRFFLFMKIIVKIHKMSEPLPASGRGGQYLKLLPPRNSLSREVEGMNSSDMGSK